MIKDIELTINDGVVLVSSRDIAERFGKRHNHVLRAILSKIELNPILGTPKFFIESEYIDKSNRKSKEYLMTRDGFSFIVMGFTGKEADEWKLKYIEAFNKMEAQLKAQNKKSLPTTYKQALIQLLEQVEQNEKLLEEVDRYQRFLCEKTGCLTKTGLATKLDAKSQTLAATLKKNGVYTSTSQVSSDFLKQYPNVKLIVDRIVSYADANTGKVKEKKEWQWTYEGAKTVVDYLISKGCVTFTENDGFKLNVSQKTNKELKEG